ncbi:hypothetical protein LXA43DRAFT_1113463 [Ganoderma leucocontextum]|nr:hypothetical protein LXA43DRAFT_1113463 [Ganoderma leucocontextum]
MRRSRSTPPRSLQVRRVLSFPPLVKLGAAPPHVARKENRAIEVPELVALEDDGRGAQGLAPCTIGSNSPVLCHRWFFKLQARQCRVPQELPVRNPEDITVALLYVVVPPGMISGCVLDPTRPEQPLALTQRVLRRRARAVTDAPLSLLNASMCTPTRRFTRALPTIIHLTVINSATYNFLQLFRKEHAEPAEGESGSMISWPHLRKLTLVDDDLDLYVPDSARRPHAQVVASRISKENKHYHHKCILLAAFGHQLVPIALASSLQLQSSPRAFRSDLTTSQQNPSPRRPSRE